MSMSSPVVSKMIYVRPVLFLWRPYAAFHGMARKFHIEGSIITTVWTHLRMFLNSKFCYFMLKCWIMLKSVVKGVASKVQSNRACTIFNFVVLDILLRFPLSLFYRQISVVCCLNCWILLKPVPGDVGGNLHFPVTSVNRHNKTESATFSIFVVLDFL
jgi:hypothetical protein